jgi:hypothetical protein
MSGAKSQYDMAGDPDQFIIITKEIVSYVGRTYMEYTATLTEAVQQLQFTMPTPPTNPDTTNVLELEI